ncbi:MULTISPECIES: copper resistance CopC family protein [Amycolatopsis]|uniref:CopC domain-containing protein n=2 Tax=Amycolatopsis TaxID=1813 RepID=A0A1I4BXX4_9PSEU|nr:copper resistance CopC family protein [Amycolatopsis sacchari]SFK73668.1 hypothetical protein SAMN05421835_13127 [Amycolatopsis sacchari]
MRSLKALAVAGAAAALVVGAAPIAQAHNVLVSSDPAKGASIAAAPAQVRLVFNEPVDNGPNEISVTGPDGSSRWDTGPTTVSGATVSVGLRNLGPAGVYTVNYHIVSEDGHPVSDAFAFTLTTAGTGTPTTPAAATPTVAAATTATTDGTVPVWVWIIAAAVLLISGLLVARRVSR